MHRGWVCTVWLTLLCYSVSAQVQNGAVAGGVTDSSGAVIIGAKLALSNPATGRTSTVETSSTGKYSFFQVPAGVYQLAASAPGFSTSIAEVVNVRAGDTTRVDFVLRPASVANTVTVAATESKLTFDNARLSEHVNDERIEALPLNGHNVYDLLKQAPGSTSVAGVSYESGGGVAVNGVRPSFNGFFVDGASAKRLSGGYAHPLIQDSVAEFQLLTLNNAAEFGSSAGAITNLVTKSGTNQFHGSAWYAVRHDAFDAVPFFLKQRGVEKPGLRFSQFGASVGGPLKKDRRFFFIAHEGNRLRTATSAAPSLAETPEFRVTIRSLFPNSVAALLYRDFAPLTTGPVTLTLNDYVRGPDKVFGGSAFSGSGMGRFSDYVCPDRTGPFAARFAAIFGVTAQDQAELVGRCSSIPALTLGAFDRDRPFLQNVATEYPTRSAGNLFHGQQTIGRFDWQTVRHRLMLKSDLFFSGNEFAGTVPGFSADVITTAVRGFRTPSDFVAPDAGMDWTFFVSPTAVHDLKVGYAGVYSNIEAEFPGVPNVSLLDGTLGFGASTGFPRDFREHTWHLADSLTLSRARHTLRMGIDLRRNVENSDFNIGRPTYLFFDPLFFAADAPFLQAAGVNPGLASGIPAHLASNIRHFANFEIGGYLADDWRITQRWTLSLGVRYDVFTRHQEKNDLGTTFLLGPGNAVIEDLRTGAGQVQSASAFTGAPGCNTTQQIRQAQIAGVCGPGGFSPAERLGEADLNNLSPRIGFAWDVLGTGTTALRGGIGVSYEGTLYDMLSFSRYNLPYYSLNQVSNFLAGDVNRIAYGPQVTGVAPTYTGSAPAAQSSGNGPQAQGNLNAWDPANPNLSAATGIVLPRGLRDPYVFNWFLGLQRALGAAWTAEVNYVATAGRKLFRAEDINRIPGGRLPPGTCVTDGDQRTVCSQVNMALGSSGRPLNPAGRLNPNYGTLRVWKNAVNSSYHGLQVSLRRRAEPYQLSAYYTWSHSIDDGSTWFSNFTTANGSAAGEGFTTDPTQPSKDRGNSIFDVRHRVTADFVWNLPAASRRGAVLRTLSSGWTLTGITSLQTGAHWSPFDPRPRVLRSLTAGACSTAAFDPQNCVNAGGDYNLDGQANDRPNALSSSVKASHQQWSNGFDLPTGFFSTPCLGCTSNLGRNTFVGPGYWSADLSLARKLDVTERVKLQLRADVFNVLNHTNFQLPGNAGHNRINDPQFGKAGGTFPPRQMQFQVRVKF